MLTRGTWVLGTRSARPKVTVALGEPARVRFVLERARGKRWVKLRERSAALPAGASTLSVHGSSRMRPGRHRLRAVVKDAAGNRSRGDCATFVVKPRPRR